jgi:putative flippase GtrA
MDKNNHTIFFHQRTRDRTGMFPLAQKLPIVDLLRRFYLPLTLIYYLAYLSLKRLGTGDRALLRASLIALAIESLVYFLCYKRPLGRLGPSYLWDYEEGRRLLFSLILSWGGTLALVYYGVRRWGFISQATAGSLLGLLILAGNVFLCLLSYELLSYVFFGVLTYLVSVASFSLANHFIGIWIWAFLISFICAVLFAFFTNRAFVFQDKGNLWQDLGKFVLARIGSSIFFEVLLMWLMIEVLHWDEDLSRSLGAFCVTVANYFLSKFVVFRKKENKRKR